MPDAARERWRDLVERRLPRAAQPDWPMHRDHCFARILLDNTCGASWRESVRAPTWTNMTANQIDAATGLGWLNRRSPALRGKLRGPGAFTFPAAPARGFAHSALPPGHPLEPHLLHRLAADTFESRRSAA